MKNKSNTTLIAVILIAALAIGGYFIFFANRGPAAPPPALNHKPGDYIITNIYGSARLMKLTPVLVFEGIPEDVQKTVTEYLTVQEPMIRDTIIFVIRAMTEVELREPGVEEVVRDRVMEGLRQRLSFDGLPDVVKAGVTMDNLTSIHYYDFVLQ